MNWKKRLELAWENGCASARRYRGSHSDLLVPVHYKDKTALHWASGSSTTASAI